MPTAQRARAALVVLPMLVAAGCAQAAARPTAATVRPGAAAAPKPDRARAATPNDRVTTAPSLTAVNPDLSWRKALRTALVEGRRRGAALGGAVDAAAWVQGWPAPVVLGHARFRMWSVSKPVTAVSALTTAADSSRGVGAAVDRAMIDALTRSDNCAQRRVVVALQVLSRGVSAADTAFRQTLASAGATASGTPEPAPLSDSSCDAYLASTAGPLSTSRVRQPALQFGTYEWTVRDAVTFAYALGTGRYGAAGDQVLRWMRRPKARASEGSPLDYTSPLDLPPSGGRFPATWQPAYKGGWGGHEQNDFVAEQIVVLNISGRAVALAAVFRPHVQPPNDDPGTSAAPQALEDVFQAVQTRLDHVQPGTDGKSDQS